MPYPPLVCPRGAYAEMVVDLDEEDPMRIVLTERAFGGAGQSRVSLHLEEIAQILSWHSKVVR